MVGVSLFSALVTLLSKAAAAPPLTSHSGWLSGHDTVSLPQQLGHPFSKQEVLGDHVLFFLLFYYVVYLYCKSEKGENKRGGGWTKWMMDGMMGVDNE